MGLRFTVNCPIPWLAVVNLTRAASIKVMQLALTQRNGDQYPGGARGSDGNWQTSLAQNEWHARSSRVFRTKAAGQ